MNVQKLSFWICYCIIKKIIIILLLFKANNSNFFLPFDEKKHIMEIRKIKN